MCRYTEENTGRRHRCVIPCTLEREASTRAVRVEASRGGLTLIKPPRRPVERQWDEVVHPFRVLGFLGFRGLGVFGFSSGYFGLG